MQPGTPGARIAPPDVRSYPASTPLYDPDALRTIFLTFESADWEQELEAFNNTDVDVPATVVVDGRTYSNVGVHFRGNSSYMNVPAGLKRSLNLAFDLVEADQQLLGYKTLNLLNAMSDPSFVRTVLFSRIAGEYLPTPKTNFARVVINGESWGVYVNVQQFNKDWTRDFHRTTEGARWKVPGSPGGRAGMEYFGDDINAYRSIYEIKSKDDPKRWAELVTMFRILNTTPADQLEEALAPILDVDNVLRFLAADIAMANTDGYWTRASDYAIYQDTKGKFSVLPLDMNEAFMGEGGRGGGPGMRGGPPPGDSMFVGRGGRMGGGRVGGPPPIGGGRMGPGGRGPMGGGGAELDPLIGLDDPTKPLRSKLLAVPALRQRYLGYVRDIATKWLDWNSVGPIIERYRGVIAADVRADTRKLMPTEAFEAEGGPESSLRRFIDQRRAYLLRTIPPS